MNKKEMHNLMDNIKKKDNFQKIIIDRIRFWEIERAKIRESNKGFLINKEGDIHICNVVMQELKDLSNSIAPRSNSASQVTSDGFNKD